MLGVTGAGVWACEWAGMAPQDRNRQRSFPLGPLLNSVVMSFAFYLSSPRKLLLLFGRYKCP